MLGLERLKKKKEDLKARIGALEARVEALEAKISAFSGPKISDTVGNPENEPVTAAQILDEYLNGEEGEDG